MLGSAARTLALVNYTKLVIQYRKSRGNQIPEGVNWVKVVREDVGIFGDPLFKQAEAGGGNEGRAVNDEREYDRRDGGDDH